MTTWTQRIERAEVSGKFTDDDRKAAGHWCSCAIGERKGINHEEFHQGEGLQLDYDSHKLGMDFQDAVILNQPSIAKALYLKIQELGK